MVNKPLDGKCEGSVEVSRPTYTEIRSSYSINSSQSNHKNHNKCSCYEEEVNIDLTLCWDHSNLRTSHCRAAELAGEAMHFNALWWSASRQSSRANKTHGDDPFRVFNSCWTHSATICFMSSIVVGFIARHIFQFLSLSYIYIYHLYLYFYLSIVHSFFIYLFLHFFFNALCKYWERNQFHCHFIRHKSHTDTR
jgi:hypothetical protein